MNTHLSRRSVEALVRALIDLEIRRFGHRDACTRGSPVLDSLQLFGVMAILCETFDIDDPGAAPEHPEKASSWAEWILAHNPDRVVLRTSGSTGDPRACHHHVPDLLEEATFFADKLSGCRRVVTLIPAHHLYGLIWTVLVPDALDVPVVPGTVPAMPNLDPGDLVVAVPEQWQALARLRRSWPPGVIGASSAGALPAQTARTMLRRGLYRLFEIYGATETGAIGLREAAADGFELLPRWRLEPGGDAIVSRNGTVIPLPDRIDVTCDGRILPKERRDEAVKIGGHNVYPSRVAACLGQVSGVSDMAVRLGANGRLKAFVVLKDMATKEIVLPRLHKAIGALASPERPTELRFGTTLPKNPMGKPTDWS